MPPNFAARMGEVGGEKVVRINTKEATYQGKKWESLSNFQKRKFENLVVLTNPKERVKIKYD